MNETHDLPPVDQIAAPLARRSPAWWPFTLLAWLVVSGLVSFIMIRVAVGYATPKEALPDDAPRQLAAPMQMQARVLVGLLSSGLPMKKEDKAQQLEPLNDGPPLQRISYVVLCGDIVGPDEALKRIGDLRQQGQQDVVKLNAKDRQLLDALETLYRGYEKHDYRPEVLTDAQRKQIVDELGWVGELALAPPPPTDLSEKTEIDLGPAGTVEAQATGVAPDTTARAPLIQAAQVAALVYYFVIFAALGFGFLGFIGLVVLAFFMLSPRWRSRVPLRRGHGGVYIETFALWMLSFIMLALALSFISDERMIGLSGFLSLLTLGVLVWPVLRGIPWKEVRRDIGLHTGKGWWREVFAGIAGYAMALPCFAIGAILMFTLMYLQKQGLLPGGANEPTHPILKELMESSVWTKIQLVIAAAVIAPILEEITFRGLLYTHLRTATRSLALPLSMPISGLIGGFIFAAVHPQGWVAIPALGGLAFGFSIMREWRGSLLPSMVAHGLHNGILTLTILSMPG